MGRLWVIVSCVALLLGVSSAWAGDTYVHGYYRSNGTYVQPHYRSAPDGNPWNNYSTKGNVNPYTGKEGTKDPYSSGYSPYGNSGNSGYSGTNDNNLYGTPLSNPWQSGR